MNYTSKDQQIGTNKTEDKMIIEAGRRQMEELNMTAEMLKTDLKTAYIWRRQAADLITGACH